MCKEKENLVLPFIGGIMVGTILGLLFSPASGRENREKIKLFAQFLAEQIKRKIEEEKAENI
uniref:YtxH domain-containing protein n=1 Tax=candidate division WOR-3 bacterium TaxID=2052148 RepID=A0A7C2K3R2_UNCW3